MEDLNTEKIQACSESLSQAHADSSIAKLEPARCCGPVQIGLFFDGTQNNRDRDKEEYSHTNIARLYETYPESERNGIHKKYIPGVGTIFRAIGDTEESREGSAFGIGCRSADFTVLGKAVVCEADLTACRQCKGIFSGVSFLKGDAP